jgi:hypothetical protein
MRRDEEGMKRQRDEGKKGRREEEEGTKGRREEGEEGEEGEEVGKGGGHTLSVSLFSFLFCFFFLWFP